MHIITTNYNSNPNVGLFCYANNKYCLVPFGTSKKFKALLEEALQVPIHEVKAAGTELLGVFFTGNDDILLVPNIMFDSELKLLDELKIKYHVVDSELTALGNNILVSKTGIIASPEYDEEVLKELKKKTKLTVKTGMIDSLNTIGSLAILNDMGCLTSPDIKDFEIQFIEKNLKTKVTKGTVNFGSPYVHSGILCNNKGFIMGDTSGGPEVQNVDEALGFLVDE
jgi:translation initiation factor 6